MRNSKPQLCVQMHESLRVTQTAKNWVKHINEASKQIFANNLFKISCTVNTRKAVFPNRKISFKILIYELMTKCCATWEKTKKLLKKRPVLTSQFHASNLQKQLWSVIQIHLDLSANSVSLPWNVCVTVNHNIAFNSITLQKRNK